MVLPEAAGPTRMAIQPRAKAAAAASIGGSCSRRSSIGADRAGSPAAASLRSNRATPRRVASCPGTTTGGTPTYGPKPKCSLNRAAACARSSAVRMRCRYTTGKVATTAALMAPSSGAAAAGSSSAASASSHQRSTSRRLNSQGAPTRPNVRSATTARDRLSLKCTIAARQGAGMNGCSAAHTWRTEKQADA